MIEGPLKIMLKQQSSSIKLNKIITDQQYIIRQVQVDLGQIIEVQQLCIQNDYTFQGNSKIYQNAYLQQLEMLIKDIKAYLPNPDAVYYQVITQMLFILEKHFQIMEHVEQEDQFRFLTRLKSLFSILCECSKDSVFCWAVMYVITEYNLSLLDSFLNYQEENDTMAVSFLGLCINLSFDIQSALYVKNAALRLLMLNNYSTVQMCNTTITYFYHLWTLRVPLNYTDLQQISQVLAKILLTNNVMFYSAHNKKFQRLLEKVLNIFIDVFKIDEHLNTSLQNHDAKTLDFYLEKLACNTAQ